MIITHLRVFGCLYYAKDLVVTDKFASNAIPFIFMGYYEIHKGYRLYNLVTHALFVARDVKFLEHVFRFEIDMVDLLPLFFDQCLDDDSSCISDILSQCEGETNLSDDDEDVLESDNLDHVRSIQIDQYILRISGRLINPLVWHKDYQMPNTSINHPITAIILLL